jgi:hypothetical protein
MIAAIAWGGLKAIVFAVVAFAGLPQAIVDDVATIVRPGAEP